MLACLGIDTSCYATSVALCGGAAEGLFFQARRMLAVPVGERGLMQSEAVFQHVTHLPALLETMLRAHPHMQVQAVCASERPRPNPDSYMPVFRAGEGTARAVAAALRVPFFATSHQQGHLRAARVGTGLNADTPLLSLHVSGGTTEVLTSRDTALTLLGGTGDLHAGQLIDRVGVAMGLPFPAGPHLEKLAAQGEAASRLSTSVRGLTCHFSGAETRALTWLADGVYARETIAAEVFSCVARQLARLVLAGCALTGLEDALLGGGVMASHLIRQELSVRVAKRNRRIRLYFARPELSGDNAVGVGLIGLERIVQEVDYGGTDHRRQGDSEGNTGRSQGAV